MPDWNEILNEIIATGISHDEIRRRYLKELHEVTGRNVIIYYSGWLQKQGAKGIEVNDADKTGFMTVIHYLDRSKGLDLILHTPGGGIAATESLVVYLREMFGTDIRVFVPELAMSAGTMIACACKEIFMGTHSSLGPTDPQIGGISAHGVVDEFKRISKEVKEDPSKILVWQPILAKYQPAFVVKCEQVIDWANEMVAQWLQTGMFKNLAPSEQEEQSAKVMGYLADPTLSKSHDRHLSYERCKEIGLEVRRLEDDKALQDAVLSVHYACVHTLGATAAFKIIENHEGKAFIQQIQAPQNASQENQQPSQKQSRQKQPPKKQSRNRRKR